MSDFIIVARRAPQEHRNGAPGRWWVTYRVREVAMPIGLTHVLEVQYAHDEDSTLCKVHCGRWDVLCRGLSGLEVVMEFQGDTGFFEAESLHPWHEAMRASVVARKVREARIAQIMTETHFPEDRYLEQDARPMSDEDVEEDEREWAQAEFERRCKAVRIWSKVMANAAPANKVAGIRLLILSEFRARVLARLARHHALLAELDALKEE